MSNPSVPLGSEAQPQLVTPHQEPQTERLPWDGSLRLVVVHGNRGLLRVKQFRAQGTDLLLYSSLSFTEPRNWVITIIIHLWAEVVKWLIREREGWLRVSIFSSKVHVYPLTYKHTHINHLNTLVPS